MKTNEFLISSGIGLIVDYPLIHIKQYTTVNGNKIILSLDELTKINLIVNDQIRCFKEQTNE